MCNEIFQATKYLIYAGCFSDFMRMKKKNPKLWLIHFLFHKHCLTKVAQLKSLPLNSIWFNFFTGFMLGILNLHLKKEFKSVSWNIVCDYVQYIVLTR